MHPGFARTTVRAVSASSLADASAITVPVGNPGSVNGHPGSANVPSR